VLTTDVTAKLAEALPLTQDEIDGIYAKHSGDGGPTAICELFAPALLRAALAAYEQAQAEPVTNAMDVVESAFYDGFNAPETYNDTVLNDSKTEWESRRGGYAKALAAHVAQAATPAPSHRQTAAEPFNPSPCVTVQLGATPAPAEPVAWLTPDGKLMRHDPSETEEYHNLPRSTPLYAVPKAATPAPALLVDRLRAKEAQEIASKFDTRAALEKARKDRAATPAPAERPVPDRRTALESTQEGRAVIAQAQADIATPAPAPHPLTDEQIDLQRPANLYGTAERWGFKDGVRFAEQHYGIGQGKEASK